MAARLRPARIAIAPRGFARPKTSAITVSTAIFRPLHYAGAPFRRSEKWPTSLIKPNWSDTSPPGCVQVCRARPCTHRVAARALRSAVEESDLLASRWRAEAWLQVTGSLRQTRQSERWLCGGVGVREQPTLRFSLRCEAGCRLCFPGQNTRAVIFKAAPFCRVPLARDPRQTGPRRLPRDPPRRRPGSLRYNCVLCPIRLLHCHADCYSAPSRSCGQSVRQFAGILHANAAAPPELILGRVCNPEIPRPPRMLAPSIPRGLR